MARIARVVAPGFPHHVIQRGNRRMQTFFNDDDYTAYLRLMREWCGRKGVDIWAYCLMPNHVHFIMVPSNQECLKAAVGEAHRRYTRMINFREGWRGYLWQGRFASYVLDNEYLIAAVRYIEINPVKAGLVQHPEEWQWSSARYHIHGEEDPIINESPLKKMITGDWKEFLFSALPEQTVAILQKHERTGRPLGDKSFIKSIETIVNRDLLPRKAGRKRKQLQLHIHYTYNDI